MILFAVVTSMAATVGVPLVQRMRTVIGGEPHVPVSRSEPSADEAGSFEVYANGIVEGRQRELALRFEIVGRLVAVDVREGAAIRQGQVLARLDSSVWDVELARAKANVAKAKAEHELLVAGSRPEVRRFARAEARRAKSEASHAKKTLDRISGLAAGRVITDQELDDKRALLQAATAKYEAAIAKLEEAEADPRKEEVKIALAKIAMEEAQVRYVETMLTKTQLRAPCDGIVLRRRGEPGELVGPESEEPLLIVADSNEPRVRAFVEELDAMHVGPDCRAYVLVDGMPNVRFPGQVVHCAPYMVPKTNFSNKPSERVDVKVREIVIRLDRGEKVDRLVIGLPVECYIERLSMDNTLAGDQLQMTSRSSQASKAN
jgi:multidrug resistance efflux pump